MLLATSIDVPRLDTTLELQHRVQPADGEDPLDLGGAWDDHESPAPIPRSSMSTDDQGQTARIEKPKPAQVQRDQWRPSGLYRLKAVREHFGGREIQLTRHDEHRSPIVFFHPNG
jgi:hypothetical protein